MSFISSVNGLFVAVTLAACTSSQQSVLPKPPSEPQVIDPSAQSVDSGLSLSSDDEINVLQKAEAGDRDAAFRLSLHFMSNEDYAQAKRWQLIAAQRGHSVAQYNQWFDLKEKKDCASMNEALMWLKAAADGESKEAKSEVTAYEETVKSCIR